MNQYRPSGSVNQSFIAILTNLLREKKTMSTYQLYQYLSLPSVMRNSYTTSLRAVEAFLKCHSNTFHVDCHNNVSLVSVLSEATTWSGGKSAAHYQIQQRNVTDREHYGTSTNNPVRYGSQPTLRVGGSSSGYLGVPEKRPTNMSDDLNYSLDNRDSCYGESRNRRWGNTGRGDSLTSTDRYNTEGRFDSSVSEMRPTEEAEDTSWKPEKVNRYIAGLLLTASQPLYKINTENVQPWSEQNVRNVSTYQGSQTTVSTTEKSTIEYNHGHKPVETRRVYLSEQRSPSTWNIEKDAWNKQASFHKGTISNKHYSQRNAQFKDDLQWDSSTRNVVKQGDIKSSENESLETSERQRWLNGDQRRRVLQKRQASKYEKTRASEDSPQRLSSPPYNRSRIDSVWSSSRRETSQNSRYSKSSSSARENSFGNRASMMGESQRGSVKRNVSKSEMLRSSNKSSCVGQSPNSSTCIDATGTHSQWSSMTENLQTPTALVDYNKLQNLSAENQVISVESWNAFARNYSARMGIFQTAMQGINSAAVAQQSAYAYNWPTQHSGQYSINVANSQQQYGKAAQTNNAMYNFPVLMANPFHYSQANMVPAAFGQQTMQPNPFQCNQNQSYPNQMMLQNRGNWLTGENASNAATGGIPFVTNHSYSDVRYNSRDRSEIKRSFSPPQRSRRVRSRSPVWRSSMEHRRNQGRALGRNRRRSTSPDRTRSSSIKRATRERSASRTSKNDGSSRNQLQVNDKRDNFEMIAVRFYHRFLSEMAKKGDVDAIKVPETEKWLNVANGNLLTYMEQKYASGMKLFFEKHPEWFEINKDGTVSVQKKPDRARDEHKKKVVSGEDVATKSLFRKRFPCIDKSKNTLTKEPQSERSDGEGQSSDYKADDDFTSEDKMEIQYIKTVKRSTVSTAKVSKDTTSQIINKTSERKLVTATAEPLTETIGSQKHEAKDSVAVKEQDSQKKVLVDSKLGTKTMIVEDKDSGEKVDSGENKCSTYVPELAQISSDDKTFKKPSPVRLLRRRTAIMNRNFNRKPELKKQFLKLASTSPENKASLDKSDKNTSDVMQDIVAEEENFGIDVKLESVSPTASGKQESKGGSNSPTDRSVASVISVLKDNKTMNATETKKDLSEDFGSVTELEDDKTIIEETKVKPSSPNKRSASAVLGSRGKKKLKIMESEKPEPDVILSAEDFDNGANLQVTPALEIGESSTKVIHSPPSKKFLSAKEKKFTELEKTLPEILSEKDFDNGAEIVIPTASQLEKAEPEGDSESKRELEEVASVGQGKKGKRRQTRGAKTMCASRLQGSKMLKTARLKIVQDITSHILRRKSCVLKRKRNARVNLYVKADEATDLHNNHQIIPEINSTEKSDIEAEFQDNSVAKPVDRDNLEKDVPDLLSVKECEHVHVPAKPECKIAVVQSTSQLKEKFLPGTRRSPRAQNGKRSDNKVTDSKPVVLDVTTGVASQVESGSNKTFKTSYVKVSLEDKLIAEHVPVESMDNFIADSSTLKVGEHTDGTSVQFEVIASAETAARNLKNKQGFNMEAGNAKPDPVTPQMEVQEKPEGSDEISTLKTSGKKRQVARRSRGCRRRASGRQKVNPVTKRIPARVQQQRRGCSAHNTRRRRM